MLLDSSYRVRFSAARIESELDIRSCITCLLTVSGWPILGVGFVVKLHFRPAE